MTFNPHSRLDQAEVQERVDTTIEDNDVALFIKGTELMPQCGYSRRALGLMKQYREDIAVVDTLESLEEFRSALKEHSGWETIPQAYVNGEFIGGSDVVAELDERGELSSLLE